MIIIIANTQVKAVFQKTISVMGTNVEWDGTFVIQNNSIILPCKNRAVAFSFDNRRVMNTVLDTDIKSDEEISMQDNKLLENAFNILLYIFGKWGEIKGLTVEKNYDQLQNMINQVLLDINVQIELSKEKCRFYHNNIQVTYEEIIEMFLALMEPEDLGDEDEDNNNEQVDAEDEKRIQADKKYRIGLWHKMVWTSEDTDIVKGELSIEDRKKSRIGKDFYISNYQCPACHELMHMVVYPVGKEFKIETDEGSVILARAYTCSNCNRLYTARPNTLIAEGKVYVIDFEVDKPAYEDYIAIVGENGERTSNCNYNRYEVKHSDNLSEEQEEQSANTDIDEIKALKAFFDKIKLVSDNDILEVKDKMDSDFYTQKSIDKYEHQLSSELGIRGIVDKGTRTRRDSSTKDKGNFKKQSSVREVVSNKTEAAGNTGNTENTGNIGNIGNTYKIGNTYNGIKEAVSYVVCDNKDMFDGIVKKMSIPQLKELKSLINTATEVADVKKKDYTDGIVRVIEKQQETGVIQKAMSVKEHPYDKMRLVYEEIQKEECPPKVKDTVLQNMSGWMRQRGAKELEVITSHIPDNITRTQYKQFKEKIEAYKHIDNSTALQKLDFKRDIVEKNEITAFIKKINTRPNDRSSLMKVYNTLKEQDFEKHNTEPFLEKIHSKVYDMDKAQIQRICPDVLNVTFDEGLSAYKKISEGDYQPELKVDILARIDRRLSTMKRDECVNLVKKLSKDLNWNADDYPGVYMYDLRRMENEENKDNDSIIIRNAINTYASLHGKYEYPVMVYDISHGANGKKGFLVTPDYIYYNCQMSSGVLDVDMVKNIYLENGLLNKGIYAEYEKIGAIKIATPTKLSKGNIDKFVSKVKDFVKYLQEKPESRSIEYMSKEKHEVKCCYRCGYVYESGNVCPKCGSANND